MTLAAVNRFRIVDDVEPKFFEKHWLSIRAGTCVIEFWDDPQHRLLLGLASSAGLEQAASTMELLIADASFDDQKAGRFDRQLELCLRSLRKVCHDPQLPDWLIGAKHVIDACFEDGS